MTIRIHVRPVQTTDITTLDTLYPAAFPDEDLLPVVHELSKHRDDVRSTVAILDGDVIGHVMFSRCSIARSEATFSLLAPLAVHPDCQKQGIGSALVNEGLSHLRSETVEAVFVLGDPGYYGRFGFDPSRDVAPPYAVPDEWADGWQVLPLSERSVAKGTLAVPEPWRKPELWLP